MFVPLHLRRSIDAILAVKHRRSGVFDPPRYEVMLAYGSRLEPWIVSVAPISP